MGFFGKKLFILLYLFYKKGTHNLQKRQQIPGKNFENLEKSWKNHGILLVSRSGNPEITNRQIIQIIEGVTDPQIDEQIYRNAYQYIKLYIVTTGRFI